MTAIDDAQLFLPNLWNTHATYQPHKEALVCGDVRRSWRDFNGNMNRIANALRADGIGTGDKVAVLMTNSVETLEVIFGVVRSGACVVPLSGLLTGEQIAGLIEDSGARLMICSTDYIDRIDGDRDRLPSIGDQGFVCHGGARAGWVCYNDYVAEAGVATPFVPYEMSDEFNIIYSSGTTGLPKGIVQTHRARQHWAYSNSLEMRFHAGARVMTTTPVYSNGTWLMILPALFTGATVVMLPQFEPRAVLETIERERITHTFMVPTQFIVTLDDPAFGSFDLSSLEAVLCAGSPLRPDTKADVLEKMTPRLYELYGFSEGFATMNRPETQGAKPTSVGSPVLGFELKIIGDDGGEAAPGEVGEIAGYGAGMMTAYHRRPDATQEIIWKAPDGRTFLRSGDIGRLDEDGFLYILDRKKDMIISGGFNIFPADIEAVVGEHPMVSDVTVIGIPHAKWGETPLALVIPNDGADPEAIQTWANERLGNHQRLTGVRFRDGFPRNALGKVLKRYLRDEYAAELR